MTQPVGTTVQKTLRTVPVATRQNGHLSEAPHPLPARFVDAEIDINCTTGDPANPFTGFAKPFNDPNMALTFGVQWSWDGGLTFPASTEGTQNGSVDGTWGSDHHTGLPIMVPSVSLSVPFNAALGGHPNAYQGYATLAGGPVTFGVTITETVTTGQAA